MPSLANTESTTLVNFGVAIPDHEREPSHAVAEVHQQVPRLLSNPGSVGVRRDAQEMDAAGGVLDDEQHGKPMTQQGVDAEQGVARMPWAWAVRNCRQVGPLRRSAGSMPARFEDQPHRAGCKLVTQPGKGSPWIRR